MSERLVIRLSWICVISCTSDVEIMVLPTLSTKYITSKVLKRYCYGHLLKKSPLKSHIFCLYKIIRYFIWSVCLRVQCFVISLIWRNSRLINVHMQKSKTNNLLWLGNKVAVFACWSQSVEKRQHMIVLEGKFRPVVIF